MVSQLASPYPFGATLHAKGCNFSVNAPDCDQLTLVLFGEDELSCEMIPFTDQVSSIRFMFVEGVRHGQQYAYLIEKEGENYLLLDPYAKAISRPLTYTETYDVQKSWGLAKSMIYHDQFDWQGSCSPNLPREEIILFEAHVKGTTQCHPNIQPEMRGTYLALASDEMIHFYQYHGVNAIQLMPVTASMAEPHLIAEQKVNYWGYNPVMFMAPDPRYAQKDAVKELKTCIRILHQHHIEVILDVVFNHTAEAGLKLHLKALNQHCYLRINGDDANYTGCGNTLNLDYTATLQLVMDALRHWVTEYHVDGFRFDLAATLGRNGAQFNQQAAFFKAIEQDPILNRCKLIAEPWDIGPEGYQLGRFPFRWHECNDQFRDIVRSVWRGDSGCIKEVAKRVMGSLDIYAAIDWPYKLAVNYICYHDGFTLEDLVSFQEKHNQANGENNQDGHNDNRSHNYGVEGYTEDETILSVRYQQKRNLMATLLFSFGIPHLPIGDLISHSQNGNNNPYCQDNEICWLNWQLNERQMQFKQWISQLIKYRQQVMPAFIRAFSGMHCNANRIVWRNHLGEEMTLRDWDQGSSFALQLGQGVDGPQLLYLFNFSAESLAFMIPSSVEYEWRVVCDTSLSFAAEMCIYQAQLDRLPQSVLILHTR